MLVTRIAEWLGGRKRGLAHGAAAGLTPVFYVLAFPPYGFGEAAFVFLVPFALWLRFRPSYKEVFWTGLGIGWVSWLVLIFWLRHVTWVGMAGLAGIVGAHFALWAMGTAWLARRTLGVGMWGGVPLTLGAGALWVVIEHMRGWIFTGFPWLPLSASQWDQPIMLQSAAVCGAWSVSFVLATLNFGVAGYLMRLVGYAATKKREICPEFYVALTIMVGLTFMQLRQTSGQEREMAFRAGVMQPVVEQNEKWDAAYSESILERVGRQTTLLGKLEPDAIFWPEAVLPYPLNDRGHMQKWTESLAKEAGAPIFAGALGIEPGAEGEEERWYNSVFLVRSDYGLFPNYYSKRHLVPFGEYIPLRRFWPWISTFVPLDGDILPGERALSLPLDLERTTVQVGSLICYEDVFPGLARASTLEGAGLFFVSTNSAWYGRGGAAAQHMAHSVLRAVENRRVTLRVGNDALSAWIDEYGNVRDTLTPYEQEWTIWDITRDRRWVGKLSGYVRYGDWFVWVCYGLLGVCALWARGQREGA